MLRILELLADLKADFHKSKITGVNMAAEQLVNIDALLKCKVGETPFSYLRFLVAAYYMRLEVRK